MIIPKLLECIEVENMSIKINYQNNGKNKRIPVLLIPRISKRCLAKKHPDKTKEEIIELNESLKREIFKAKVILNNWNQLPKYCDRQYTYDKLIEKVTERDLIKLNSMNKTEITEYLNEILIG